MALSAPSPPLGTTPSSLAGSRVLIGFADALAAPEVAWSLLAGGVRVTAFARRGSRPALRRCGGVEIVEITAPERDAKRSLNELGRLLHDASYSAVMPLNDAAVWLCSSAHERAPVVPVAGPVADQAALALDKRLQIEAARRAGFMVPTTHRIESVAALLALTELPLALKPALPIELRDGRLVRGANFICGTRSELESAARSWRGAGPLLAQPLIRGTGEGLFGIAGETGLRALSAHRRIRMMNPQGSGSSACASAPVDRELVEPAERMLADAHWSGMFMLEFLRDDEGTAWFMELNGRPWGSMALARRIGLEYPAWALRQLIDPRFEPPSPATSRDVVCRHLGREIVHLLHVLRGPRSVAVTSWPSRRRTVRDVLRVGRDDRWYNWNRRDWRLFADDALRTILENGVPRRRS
jgi:predicted ATP-grasp superfamily ATP-dependent carboligase